MSGFQQGDKNLPSQKWSSPTGTFQCPPGAAWHHHCCSALATCHSKGMNWCPPPSKAMENKALSTNWEHVWMSRLIHSSRRKSSLKLWKQSVALKKQLRHNWNHQAAQKPAGDPPPAPWCQQVLEAEDSSLGNEDFYNLNLNSFKQQNVVFMDIKRHFHTVHVNIHAAVSGAI